MFRLALRTLRFHKGGCVASFIALLFGATIVMACGGLMETGIRTAVPPQRLAAAPIVVTGEQSGNPERVRLDPGLVGTLRTLPGVTTAVPDVSFPATVLHSGRSVSGGALRGHDWSAAALAPYRLVSGTAPAGPDDVVLAGSAGAKAGDTVRMAVAGTVGTFTVTGVAAGPAPAVFFPDQQAQRYLGTSGIDSIGVLPAPGTDLDGLAQRIDDTFAGKAIALTGDDRGVAEFPQALTSGDSLIPLAGVFGGLAIMVAIFVVVGTLGLSVRQRFRELALLRAVGTTPGQLRRMIIGETLVLSVLATALSCLPGEAMGRWLFGQLAGHGVVPSVIVFHESWIPLVVGVGTALLTALGAAVIAARRAATARPTEALAEAAVQRRWLTWFRLILAILCFGGATALAILTVTVMSGPVAASTAGPSAMLFAFGFALIGPGVTKVVAAVLRPPLRLVSGASGRLAMLTAKTTTVRLAGAVTPIMLATGLATAMIYLQTTQVAAEQQAAAGTVRADAVLTSTTGGMPLGLVDAVRRVPGVGAASAYLTSDGRLLDPDEVTGKHHGDEQDDEQDSDEQDDLPLRGVTAPDATMTNGLPVVSGSLADLVGDSVALPVDLAGQTGDGIGQSVAVQLGDGTKINLRVVAVFSGHPGFDTMLLPTTLLAEHTTTGLTSTIVVRAAAGVAPDRLLGALRAFAADRPGVAVSDGSVLTAAATKSDLTGAWVNYLLVAMIVGYTVIALVNTLIMATTARRREFALQRVIGSTGRQVITMMGTEGLLIALAGIVLGTMIAAGTLVPFSLTVLGSPCPQGPLWIYLTVVGVALALTITATLVPTSFTLRRRAVNSIAVE